MHFKKPGLYLALALAIPILTGARRHVRGTVPIPTPPPNGTPSGKSGIDPMQLQGRPTTKPSAASVISGSREQGVGGEPANCSEKHPIETFVQISSAHSPQASKRGGVYFLSDLREVPQVFYLQKPGAWPTQVSFFADGVAYFQVSPDGAKVLIATHIGGNEQYNIHLLDAATGKISPLLVDPSVRIESVVWDPSSSWFAFTSNARNKTDMDLYRFLLSTAQSELLHELKGANSVTDVSPNGKLIAFTQIRSINDSDIFIYELAEKKISNLTHHSEMAAYLDGLFTKDAKSIFAISDVERGTKQLLLIPLDPKKPRRTMSSGNWDVEGFSLDDSRTQIAYVTNEEGYGTLSGYLLDAAGGRGRNLAVPTDRGTIQRVPSFAPSKRGFFYSQSSSVSSSDIWFWRHPKATRWTQSTQGLMRAECFTREKLVRYPSFDKRQIPAFLYYPQDQQGPIPFIVYVHGGPEAQYRPTFSKIFQYFLERGFGVFAPNVRGSTGYGREFTLLDNYKKRMDSVQDAIEGARWLIANRYSQTGKLAIYGGSYGGFMVLRSIQVEPDLFAAASESVGISNFVTFLKNTKPYRRALREVEYGPLSDEDFLSSVSPMSHLDRLKTPLLIFHGANDPRVPVAEAEQIVAELKKKEIGVESKIFLDEGHGNTKLRNIMEQARTMVYFFEKYVRRDEKN